MQRENHSSKKRSIILTYSSERAFKSLLPFYSKINDDSSSTEFARVVLLIIVYVFLIIYVINIFPVGVPEDERGYLTWAQDFYHIISIDYALIDSNLFVSPYLFISIIIVVIYTIYYAFVIHFFVSRYLNRIMTGYLSVIPGLFHIVIFIYTLTSAAVAVTTPTVIVSNQSIKVMSVLIMVYCFPGLIIGIIGDVLQIKVQTKRCIISPWKDFQFLFIMGGSLVLKLFQQYPSFRHLSPTVIVLSAFLVFFTLKHPFTSSIPTRVVLLFLALCFFFNSIITAFLTYYSKFNFYSINIAMLVLMIVSLIAAIIYQYFTYRHAKSFDYSVEGIMSSKISSTIFLGYISLRQDCLTITPELFDTVREKWPDAIDLHLFLFALSISQSNTLLKRQDIFSSLSCLSKRTFFNELYFLLTLDIYSKYNDDDCTSLQKFAYLDTIETVNDLMYKYWNYILYDNATISQNIIYQIYKKVEQFKKLYQNLSEFEKQFKFFKLPYYMFVSKISCECDQIRDVMVDAIEPGNRNSEWIMNDDAEFVNGKFKLFATKFGDITYKEGEYFLDREKVKKSKRGDIYGKKFVRGEFIVTLLTVIVPFIICFWSGATLIKFIHSLDKENFYEINQFTYVYSAFELLFWDVFANTTTNSTVDYEVLSKTLDEMYVNESRAFNQKKWLNNRPEILVNFKSTLTAAKKILGQLQVENFSQIVVSNNFTVLTKGIQRLTEYLFMRGYKLIDDYHSLIVSHEDTTKIIFRVIEIIIGVDLICFIAIQISLGLKLKLLFAQPLLLKKKVVNYIMKYQLNPNSTNSKRSKSEVSSINFTTRQLLIHLISMTSAIVLTFSCCGVSLLVSSHIYNRYKFIMACTFLPSLKVASLFTLTGVSYNVTGVENYVDWLEYYRMECGSILGITFPNYATDFNESGLLPPDYLIYIESPEVLRLTRDKDGAKYLVMNSALTELITDSADVLKNPELLISCLRIQEMHRQENETLMFSIEMENSWKWEEGVAFLFCAFSLLIVVFAAIAFSFSMRAIIRIYKTVRLFTRFINTLPSEVPWDDGVQMRCIPFPHETISTRALKVMPVGVFATNSKGIVISANWAATNFFPESIVVGQPLGELSTQRVLPNGTTQHFKIDTTLARSYMPNINSSMQITVIKDITTMHALKAEFTKITKQLATLNDSFFPSSVSTHKDGCTYAETICSVDVYFPDGSDLIENQAFGDKMKEFADRFRTMFSYNNFQWSFNFVFTTYGTFSCDNQHFKDAIAFTLHVLSERDDVRIGVSGADGAFCLVNRTSIHGLLVMSPSLPTANALTKYANVGGVAVDWRVLKMISNSEIEVDTLQKAYIFGREIEYMVFPDGNSLLLFINS